MTLAGYDAMPDEDCKRHEIVGGELVEMPGRTIRHQRALMVLLRMLLDHLPDHLEVVHSFDVLLEDGPRPLLRKPDLVVTRDLRDDVTRFDARDVALVVEIMSEESEHVDLSVKLREYAAAGIPDYWIVALDRPASMAAYALADGRYELSAAGTRTIDVLRPAPMALNLDELIR
ncbi:Uma2 family endonuclease [Lentzea sp. NPDC003310]|uniref:Uma2 family endonuclease n=1 Tax=Lentzea sp. NPDC003310 TaxID=3154447 RepID=UPI0033AD243D